MINSSSSGSQQSQPRNISTYHAQSSTINY